MVEAIERAKVARWRVEIGGRIGWSGCMQHALPRPISSDCPISLVTRMEDWGTPFPFELMC